MDAVEIAMNGGAVGGGGGGDDACDFASIYMQMSNDMEVGGLASQFKNHNNTNNNYNKLQ
jgi:hypothetical protein